MLAKLMPAEIKKALEALPGWIFEDNSIKKNFVTQNYPSTMGLVAAIGGFCQRHNHHPDYILMKYKEVEVSFSTHSEGGVTQKDIDIALELEKIPL